MVFFVPIKPLCHAGRLITQWIVAFHKPNGKLKGPIVLAFAGFRSNHTVIVEATTIQQPSEPMTEGSQRNYQDDDECSRST